jgi:triacylglycerol esterase/lipase EstA (alpha/beta hydrolase family)
MQQLTDYLGNFRQAFNVAAVQADVVAHSMGGDIVRTMVSLSNCTQPPGGPCFQSSDTYGQGPIHKLITIGTPHQGTPLAGDLLNPTDSCVANVLAFVGDMAFTSVWFQSSPSTPVSGAVADMENGVSGNIPFPIAYVAGVTSNNLDNLQCTFCTALLLRTACAGNPLANVLNQLQWNTVFNSALNDAIVPATSQLNGTTTQTLLFYSPGVIHSHELVILDFLLPSELDSLSGVPDAIVDLLNEPTDGNDFQH